MRRKSYGLVRVASYMNNFGNRDLQTRKRTDSDGCLKRTLPIGQAKRGSLLMTTNTSHKTRMQSASLTLSWKEELFLFFSPAECGLLGFQRRAFSMEKWRNWAEMSSQ